MTILFEDAQLGYLQELVRQDIQAFYDDPPPDQIEIREAISMFRAICDRLGLDFDQIVSEEATDYEQERIDQRLRANPSGWKMASDTQFRYTPDPGEHKDDEAILCGVCGTEASVSRNVDGPRGYAQAMSGGKSLHDVYECPRANDEWHRRVVAIRQEARKTASHKHRDMLRQEAYDVLEVGLHGEKH
jgi:hypothetical protein